MIIQINLFLFPKKRRLYDRKKTRLHSKKSKRLKRTAALEAKDPNSYIPIYSPKRLRRMGQQGERTHYPTRWCVNEPDAWFSSQRTVVRANKKQTYLKGGAGVRKLRVHYRKTAPEEIDTTIFTFPKTSNIYLIELRELHILQLCQKFSNIFSNTDIDIVTRDIH